VSPPLASPTSHVGPAGGAKPKPKKSSGWSRMLGRLDKDKFGGRPPKPKPWKVDDDALLGRDLAHAMFFAPPKKPRAPKDAVQNLENQKRRTSLLMAGGAAGLVSAGSGSSGSSGASDPKGKRPAHLRDDRDSGDGSQYHGARRAHHNGVGPQANGGGAARAPHLAQPRKSRAPTKEELELDLQLRKSLGISSSSKGGVFALPPRNVKPKPARAPTQEERDLARW